jgi:hypothetical protein
MESPPPSMLHYPYLHSVWPLHGPASSYPHPLSLLGPYHNPHSLRIQPRTRQEEIMREFDVTQVRLEEFE